MGKFLKVKKAIITFTLLIFALSSNLCLQNIFDPLSGGGGKLKPYLVGETGIMVVMVILLIAFIFWTRRDKLQDMMITGS